MRSFASLLVLLSALSLSGCGSASASASISASPPHCLAAFYWGRFRLMQNPPPRHAGIWQMAIGGAYNMSKLNAGASDAEINDDALQFIKQHQDDKDLMIDLLKECTKVEFADPWFQSHKAALAALALKSDPDCKRDATVCTN